LNETKGNVDVGIDSVVMGQVFGKVGDRSVVIGAMDQRGNVILNQTMAVGYSAYAAPGSIAIGAHARAGSELVAALQRIGRIIHESDDRHLRVSFDNLMVELGKKERDRGSIRALWTVVETSATLAGAIDFVQRVSYLLRAAGLV
jgi:hypothetical protein